MPARDTKPSWFSRVIDRVTDLLGNPIVLSGEQRVNAHNGDNLQLGLDSPAIELLRW